MAQEGAFTLPGFESPEQVRARIMGQRQAQEQALAAQAPAGFTAGRQLVQGLAGAFGAPQGPSPEEMLAAQRQQFLQGVDLTDRDQLISKSREALSSGDVQLGTLLADRALQIEPPKQDKTSYGNLRDSYLMGMFGVRPGSETKEQMSAVNQHLENLDKIMADKRNTARTPTQAEILLGFEAQGFNELEMDGRTDWTPAQVAAYKARTTTEAKQAQAAKALQPKDISKAGVQTLKSNLAEYASDLPKEDRETLLGHVTIRAGQLLALQPELGEKNAGAQAIAELFSQEAPVLKRTSRFGGLLEGYALDQDRMLQLQAQGSALLEKSSQTRKEQSIAGKAKRETVKRYNPATGRIE